MAGAALSAGVLAACLAFAGGLAAVGAAAVVAQRAAAAADAAALAAADAASGAVAGLPCERAAELAVAGGTSLESCEVAGLVATVRVRTSFGMLPVAVVARAGPPGANRAE